MADEFELASSLFGSRRAELALENREPRVSLTSATAVSDSEDGYVNVIMAGDTISDRTNPPDGETNAILVPTSVSVKRGDTVVVSLNKLGESAKPMVMGNVGEGDRRTNETNAKFEKETLERKADIKKAEDSITSNVSEKYQVKGHYTTTEDLTNSSTVLGNSIDSLRGQVDSNKTETDSELNELRIKTGDLVTETSELKQTADAFNAKISSKVEHIDGTVEEMSSYIRFGNGPAGKPEMTLGASGSKLSTAISNERLEFRDDGQTVAYISGQQMNISNAVVNTLYLGKFAFIPRSNDNLAFKWIGG